MYTDLSQIRKNKYCMYYLFSECGKHNCQKYHDLPISRYIYDYLKKKVWDCTLCVGNFQKMISDEYPNLIKNRRIGVTVDFCQQKLKLGFCRNYEKKQNIMLSNGTKFCYSYKGNFINFHLHNEITFSEDQYKVEIKICDYVKNITKSQKDQVHNKELYQKSKNQSNSNYLDNTCGNEFAKLQIDNNEKYFPPKDTDTDIDIDTDINTNESEDLSINKNEISNIPLFLTQEQSINKLITETDDHRIINFINTLKKYREICV